MPYEAWRITYQSSEQAARAAHAALQSLGARITALEGELAAAPQAVQAAVPDGYAVVSVEKINAAIQRASVFDDGGDGADPESARSVVTLLRDMLTAAPAHPSEGVPAAKNGRQVLVDSGALQMVLNALERDALEGKQVRAAMRLELMQSIANLPQPAAQGVDAQLAKLTTAYKELSSMFHDQVVAQQAAWIEWKHGNGAEDAMQWIENGLCGPGHIPDEDEPYGKEAQAWFDANKSDPIPVCACGRPSNSFWMGHGFCSEAHFDEFRAAQAKQGGA